MYFKQSIQTSTMQAMLKPYGNFFQEYHLLMKTNSHGNYNDLLKRGLLESNVLFVTMKVFPKFANKEKKGFGGRIKAHFRRDNEFLPGSIWLTR